MSVVCLLCRRKARSCSENVIKKPSNHYVQKSPMRLLYVTYKSLSCLCLLIPLSKSARVVWNDGNLANIIRSNCSNGGMGWYEIRVNGSSIMNVNKYSDSFGKSLRYELPNAKCLYLGPAGISIRVRKNTKAERLTIFTSKTQTK